VFKAESALDGVISSGHSSSNLLNVPGSKKVDPHQTVEAKLALCSALSHLSNGNYSKATQDFLQPMSAASLAPWAGNLVSMADISVYATLCALATLGRGELKTRVVEGEGLAGEGEGMKELLDYWMASNFRAVLGLLEKSSVSPPRLETPEPWLSYTPPPSSRKIRLVICSILCSAHTLRASSRSSAPVRLYSISSRLRRYGSSA
jgi:hypothetical protein